MSSRNKGSLFRKVFVLLTFCGFTIASVIAARVYLLDEVFYPISSVVRQGHDHNSFGLSLFWGTITFSLVFLLFWFRSNRSKSKSYVYKVLLFFAPNFFLSLAVVIALNVQDSLVDFIMLNDYSAFIQGYKTVFNSLFIKRNIFQISIESLYTSQLFILYWFWTPQILTLVLTLLLYIPIKVFTALSPKGELAENGEGENSGGERVTDDSWKPRAIREIEKQTNEWAKEGYDGSE